MFIEWPWSNHTSFWCILNDPLVKSYLFLILLNDPLVKAYLVLMLIEWHPGQSIPLSNVYWMTMVKAYLFLMHIEWPPSQITYLFLILLNDPLVKAYLFLMLIGWHPGQSIHLSNVYWMAMVKSKHTSFYPAGLIPLSNVFWMTPGQSIPHLCWMTLVKAYLFLMHIEWPPGQIIPLSAAYWPWSWPMVKSYIPLSECLLMLRMTPWSKHTSF